eukprot:scaffold41006_cov39-Tisochrysis_lutea.AAC.2
MSTSSARRRRGQNPHTSAALQRRCSLCQPPAEPPSQKRGPDSIEAGRVACSHTNSNRSRSPYARATKAPQQPLVILHRNEVTAGCHTAFEVARNICMVLRLTHNAY